jgi:hypothetical protein
MPNQPRSRRCVRCGATFEQAGPGRPRMLCYGCVWQKPRRTRTRARVCRCCGVAFEQAGSGRDRLACYECLPPTASKSERGRLWRLLNPDRVELYVRNRPQPKPICRGCGEPFARVRTASASWRLYCDSCRECAWCGRRAVSPGDANAKMGCCCMVCARALQVFQRRGPVAAPCFCEGCGASMRVKSVQAQLSRKTGYCKRCKHWARVPKGWALPIPWYPCTECGKQYIRGVGRSVHYYYCTDLCRGDAERRTKRERYVRVAWDRTPRACAWRKCGERFEPDFPAQRYCRGKHGELERQKRSKARRRARLERDGLEPFTLEYIAARDNWTCHICDGTVDRTNWSMDHLRPVAKGGPHRTWNVALAHKVCNQMRGVGD